MGYDLNIVVLAAGKGTRMHSDKPKVLHELAGKSLLQHTLDVADGLNASAVQVVVGHGAGEIKQALKGRNIGIVVQEPQLGTAHAVQQTLEYLDDSALALVLYGDVPLIRIKTLQDLLSQMHEKSMAVLTCHVAEPHGMGRIIRDDRDRIIAIVEEKDANIEQKVINEINTGIMAFPVKKLKQWLPTIENNNAQGEYYLTDVVALAVADGFDVLSVECSGAMEASGVNDRVQLAALERYYQQEKAMEFMLAGVSIVDPQRFDIRGDAEIGRDVIIDINVIIEGKVKIGDGVKIAANCILKDCEIDTGTIVLSNTIIEKSRIGRRCSIGPFARIRPDTELHDDVRIGNFVEIKKSVVGQGSKINHLSYLGDTRAGKNVNVGAGTITCNYDGINKHMTEIGDDVFVGSNTAVVAPVKIADGATIAAGSVVTRDVNNGQLAVARARQTNIDGWQRPKKTKR
ncbi:MAG: bifunctional UDP-N-acetylglucosamine diphosphorylase/glucosamine-1-phosphate N-acetyltransferase GlmU [Pseudomonadales bacterium]|nr:bifunctional UDP-N-acetylglucosamine diphosphorylase/glucosamine-1-phosphate N-acetyltransferase GlmU [Pseudomonadales bacterium]